MRASLAVVAVLTAVTRLSAADSAAPFPSADMLRCIRGAKTVYVFPVTKPLSPRRDDKHLRLLGPEAREALIRILGDKRDWYYGLITIAESPDHQQTDIGLLFRDARAELVLFFDNAGIIQVEFRGKRDSSMLEDPQDKKMNQWKHRYASQELAVK